MEWYHVYLFTRLDGLSFFIRTCFSIGAVSTLICGVVWFIEHDLDDDRATKFRSLFVRGIAATLLIMAVGIFIPSQKEAAAIYLLPKLAKSDFAKEAGQIPADAAKLMRLKLESWIADMEPAAKK